MNTTFYLDVMSRKLMLAQHKFYADQAKSRLLSQFSDISIELETDAAEEQYLNDYDPEQYDQESAYEQAESIGIDHYIALTDMKSTVTLALTAGMYHQFDKLLREKIAHEFSHFMPSEFISRIAWDQPFPEIVNLLEWIGMPLQSQPFIKKIDALRLIVNVYKHGQGKAHETLISSHPEYYQRYIQCIPPSPEHLHVTTEQFDEFYQAIADFWMFIPERLTEEDVCEEKIPAWLNTKLDKYNKQQQQL